MASSSRKHGPLIGVIVISESKIKFAVFTALNAEILTMHEIDNAAVEHSEGNTWTEYQPHTLFRGVVECIEAALSNMVLLQIEAKDMVGVAITNSRETCLLWDKTTGEVLCNAIAGSDQRTRNLAGRLLRTVKNRSKYLQEICGLPLHKCSGASALKVKWLCENNRDIDAAVRSGTCNFGTLDTWVIWNLTGGTETGLHVTDITNASRTMYFNLSTRTWDASLCDYFSVNAAILPKIRSCSETFGYIHDGPLRGLPIMGCIADQQALLLGQMCFMRGYYSVHFDTTDTYMLWNTGHEIINPHASRVVAGFGDRNNGDDGEAAEEDIIDNDVIGTVAFQLGPYRRVFYAIEAIAKNSGASIKWLSNMARQEQYSGTGGPSLRLFPGSAQVASQSESVYCSPSSPTATLCDSPPLLMSESTNIMASSSAFRTAQQCTPTPRNASSQSLLFVPGDEANGDHGIITGLRRETTGAQLLQAGLEGVCFQVKRVLDAQSKYCSLWPPLHNQVVVGGDLIETNTKLPQILADLCDMIVDHPQIAMPSALGAMFAAALALDLFALGDIRPTMAPPSNVFQRAQSLNWSESKFRRWLAIQEAVRLNESDAEEDEVDDHDDDNNDEGMAAAVVVVDEPKKAAKYKDPQYYVHRSIPGTMFLTTAFALLILADLLLLNE